MKKEDIFMELINICLKVSRESGLFSRKEVLSEYGKNHKRNGKTYNFFNDLEKEGIVIKQKFKMYKLSDDVLKSFSRISLTEKPIGKVENLKEISSCVIEYLNEKVGRKFKVTEKVKSQINARIKEGAKLEDFKFVIDNKCAQWMNTKMAKYLRPETLFGTKFNGYLNEVESEHNSEKMLHYDFDKYFK